ncbi:MAG: type II secretion system secretin GspD, partial [Bdellovibrionota bacterium]
ETGEGSKEVVTDFNFPDADIMDLARTMGKLTGKNFILDKDVKGKVSIISNSPITVADAWRAFLTALDMTGFSLIPSGRYIRIARQRDARDKQIPTYTGESSPDTDALVTRIFPLKYINAEEVARTFHSFMPSSSRIIPYEQTNTVIVTDTGSNIAKLNKMLEILDVEGYDAGIEVIPVKYASASELSKLIDTLLPGTGAGPGGPPGGAPRFGGGGSRFSARRTKEGGIINTIISDERTNTLIVHANTKGADQVRELVAKLDQRMPARVGGKVQVVPLQFADAEQIANTLNNISQGAQTRTGAPSPGGGTGVNPNATSLFEGAIKISADKATNALVITASPGDFVTVQRVINKLDIPRDEVYVEVVIMEVDINRNLDYSANPLVVSIPGANNNGRIAGGLITNPTDLGNYIANPAALAGAIIPAYNFVNPIFNTLTVNGQAVSVPNIFGLIKAIQTHSNANVLATPQIIALDNSEANFVSTEKIPVPQSNAVQGAVSTSVGFQNVELSIKIKPQINKISNFVKLTVTAKLGDFDNRPVPAAVSSLAQATLERSADTTVVVGDADTIVLGGLARDKISEQINKIPLLGDIPILGWLFKSKVSQSEKTNLLIFMTPHIIRQYERVRAILDKKLRERDEFIESNAGGDDPLRKQRDDLIKSLPDIKQFSKGPTETIPDEEQPAAIAVPPEGTPPTAPMAPGAQTHPGAPNALAVPQVPAGGAQAGAPVGAPNGAPAPGAPAPQEAAPPPPPPTAPVAPGGG